MSTPQQPELRRSGETPGLNPDSIGGELASSDRPGVAGPDGGHVPPGNRAGAKPAHDQDKPDLDKMAAKFGIDEPDPDGERAADAAAEVAERKFADDGAVHGALAELTSPETAEKVLSGARAVGVALGVGLFVVRPIWRRIRR